MPPPHHKGAGRDWLARRTGIRLNSGKQTAGGTMGIDTERDIEANLQIGPTDQGMVRIFVEANGIEVPMDFDPEEADDIADEIKAAAMAARGLNRKKT